MATLVWSVVTTVQGRVPLASEGLSLVTSTHKGEDFLVSFGGYNGRYSNEVYVLKPSHISDLQSRIIDGPVSDTIAAMLPTTDASRDMEIEIDPAQDKKIKEIVMENGDSEPLNIRNEVTIRLVEALKAEKGELEGTLNKEQLQTLQLKQEFNEAESRNIELTKASFMSELQSVRGQLAAEQSRCFKHEVDIAELRQKLQAMETLEKEVELLRRQKATSEQAALSAHQRQSSGGVWGWLAGSAPDQSGP
ncbi:unnamed protein product [Musa textilis]